MRSQSAISPCSTRSRARPVDPVLMLILTRPVGTYKDFLAAARGKPNGRSILTTAAHSAGQMLRRLG